MEEELFDSLFQNNYYSSEEYAGTLSHIFNQDATPMDVGKRTHYIIKNKILGLSNFNEEENLFLQNKKINFSRIINEDNNSSTNPSMREYNVVPAAEYETIYKNYKKQFRNQVQQSWKNGFEMIKTKKEDGELFEAYEIYLAQIKKLNGFAFSCEIFRKLVMQQSAFLWLLKQKNRTAGYAVTYEYKDNIYLSLKGSLQEFFHLRPNNFVYDFMLKHSSERNKNLHLGTGVGGEGFEKFKQDAGAVQLKIVENPAPNTVISAARMLWHFPAAKKLCGDALRIVDAAQSKGLMQNTDKKILWMFVPMT